MFENYKEAFAYFQDEQQKVIPPFLTVRRSKPSQRGFKKLRKNKTAKTPSPSRSQASLKRRDRRENSKVPETGYSEFQTSTSKSLWTLRLSGIFRRLRFRRTGRCIGSSSQESAGKLPSARDTAVLWMDRNECRRRAAFRQIANQ